MYCKLGDNKSTSLKNTTTLCYCIGKYCESKNCKESNKIENFQAKFVYSMFFFYGIGCLLPWNSILNALDYFESRLSNYHPSYTFSLLMYAPCLLFSFLNIMIARHITVESRIIISFISVMIITICIPLVTELLNQDSAWIIISVLIAFLGISHSFLMSSMLGFANIFPSKYITALMVGQGISGIVCGSIRILLLVAIPFDSQKSQANQNLIDLKNGERFGIYFFGNMSYFVLSAIFILLCLSVFLLTVKSNFVQYYLMKATSTSDKESSLSKKLLEFNDNNIEYHSERAKRKDDELYIQVWAQFVQLTLCYVITFCVFPGTSLNTYLNFISPFESNRTWFTIIMVTIFGIFDTVGRSLNILYSLSSKTVLLLSLLRVLFIPNFVLIQSSVQAEDFFNNDCYKLFNMIAFSFTNGVVTVQLLNIINRRVSSAQKEKAGMISNFHLQGGICLGSLLSLFLL